MLKDTSLLLLSLSLPLSQNLSQQPDIARLQQQLHGQLAGEGVPEASSATAELQAEALTRAAAGRVVLVVLDDLWRREDADHLDCIDGK